MTLSEPDHETDSRSQSSDESENEDAVDMGAYQHVDSKSGELGIGGSGAAGAVTPKRSAASKKDPSRPRRKKARRACFACQRAHLTCGDERPCQRCIKRGLQDACQDGVRKKAKYLHDAPNEALLPGAAGTYSYLGSARQGQQLSPQSPQYAMTAPNAEPYGSRLSGPYNVTPMPATATQLPMTDPLMSSSPYGPPQSSMAAFPGSAGPMQTSMQSMAPAIETPVALNACSIQDFGTGSMLDTNDLSQYNFDLASYNFGNHYGALEFGMLGHMSSGAAETEPSDAMSQMNPASGGMFGAPGGVAPTTFSSESPLSGQMQFGYSQDTGLTDWRPPTRPESNVRQSGNDYHTYFTGDGLIKKENIDGLIVDSTVGSAFASPSSDSLSYNHQPVFDDSSPKSAQPMTAPSSAPTSRPTTQEHPSLPRESTNRPLPPSGKDRNGVTKAKNSSVFAFSSRRGDPSAIYAAVTEPWSYTNGFHNLTAYLKRRFSPADILRIAKALGSIRPSFLIATATLRKEDLLFMEKCFQRTLWEYDGYIAACGTPTVVCRRTGEVAAVGREFCHLTGWKKDVLLGQAPNLNVNTGGSRSGTTTPGTAAAPSGAPADAERLHPIFLAELLDDDSVLAFFDDFARLAFGDPRGSKRTTYRLLRYKTSENNARAAGSTKDAEGNNGDDRSRRKRARGHDAGGTRATDLGKDGKIECSCSWTVKRDPFDLPLLIVLNFLPHI